MDVLKLKKANCKNCYKCIRNCPVKAIEVKNHQAQIIDSECILCGNCILVCPQNAKEVRNDVGKVKNLIRSGKKVIASVAPSFISIYNVASFGAFKECLKQLGFADAFETAEGAFVVKTEYEKIVAEHTQDTIISSCCPTIVDLIQKHYPHNIKYLAPVLSPMQAHAKIIKERETDAKVVFIGPCISKKGECEKYPGWADADLTFDELNGWMEERRIEINFKEPEEEPKYLSRFFPVAGGIIKTMNTDTDYSYVSIDGVENAINALNEIETGKLHQCFVEMSACKGSCINGPAAGKHRQQLVASYMKVQNYALDKRKNRDYEITPDFELAKKLKNEQIKLLQPSESQIAAILKKMGKHSVEDELNCGTCGYHTCREKAIAVYFGKAEISMCLPYMKAKAESFSDKIISITPNAIVTVDRDLIVQQINDAACKIFGITDVNDIIGAPISRIMDEFDFVRVVAEEENAISKRVYLAEYGKYVEQSFVYDKNSNIVICIMMDITQRELKRDLITKKKNEAVEITDKIVDKQMQIVHEIASLLGETTAETKLALTNLKSTMMMEEDDDS